MSEYKLKATSRDLGKNSAAALRMESSIPAEVYGHNQKNQHIIVTRLDFEKLYGQVGESNLVQLEIDDSKPVNVLIKKVQVDPVTDIAQHIDFYVVRMDEKLNTEIPLEYIGISKAVKEYGGVLVKSINFLPVTCLPGDLVSSVEVDLTKLEEFNDVVTIADLNIPDTIEVLLEKDNPVCSAQPPKKIEEPVVAETEEEKPEGEEGKETEEGEEPSEEKKEEKKSK